MTQPCKYCGNPDPPSSALFVDGRLDHEFCIVREQNRELQQVVDAAIEYRRTAWLKHQLLTSQENPRISSDVLLAFVRAVDAYLSSQEGT